MNRFVQDLLDVTRMEAGRLSVEPTRVTVREVVDRVVESQGPLAAAASLALRVDVAQGPLELWADRDRLQQVFENLIGNAIKFTSAGGTIVVGASPCEGEVRFQVADTGCGIAGPATWTAWGGARAPDRQGDRGVSQRPDLGREHPGPRDHVLLHDPLVAPRGERTAIARVVRARC
jgi:hypothetical protein